MTLSIFTCNPGNGRMFCFVKIFVETINPQKFQGDPEILKLHERINDLEKTIKGSSFIKEIERPEVVKKQKL